jgi:membrane-bound lytic murein transglycosylase B
MSHKRLNTWQKATALVPLALLSGAWTASLAGTGTASAAPQQGQSLPDGTSIPSQAIEAPASLSRPGEIAPGVPAGATNSVISSASTSGIPSAALAAYQRAAQVINAADPSCKITWQLIAAIGRVESDHGRYGGNTLDDDGKSVPGIYGIPLDGRDGTAKISDTDAGQYDKDPVFDRAIGPMQFIPSTWSVVGVDADGDDVRDPQDIDDAALGSAVYLCSGNEDLSTTAGQRTSVYRYNHSQDYVNLVLSIMNAYIDGDWSSVPNGAAAPTVFAPSTGMAVGSPAGPGKKDAAAHNGGKARPGEKGSGGNGGGTGSTGGSGGAGGSGGGSTGPGTPPVPDPQPSDDSTNGTGDKVKDTVDNTTDTVNDAAAALKALTQEATAYCNSQLAGESASGAQIQSCINAYVDGGKAAADGVIANILDILGGLTGGLVN